MAILGPDYQRDKKQGTRPAHYQGYFHDWDIGYREAREDFAREWDMFLWDEGFFCKV
jgi:hypothetical protein